MDSYSAPEKAPGVPPMVGSCVDSLSVGLSQMRPPSDALSHFWRSKTFHLSGRDTGTLPSGGPRDHGLPSYSFSHRLDSSGEPEPSDRAWAGGPSRSAGPCRKGIGSAAGGRIRKQGVAAARRASLKDLFWKHLPQGAIRTRACLPSRSVLPCGDAYIALHAGIAEPIHALHFTLDDLRAIWRHETR